MASIRPYGDWTDDGKIQMSFTLPIEAGERARQSALLLASQMGFTQALVAHMKPMGSKFTFFVVYGSVKHSVDPAAIEITQRHYPELTAQEVNHLLFEKLKRQLVVVGAATGTDAHTVGLDAILSMKGYAGDHGLEYFHEMRVFNLGSQVTPGEIVDVVRRENADAVLISQVVTQRDAHIHHLTEVREALESAGLRDRVILVGGGPRFTPEQAADLGYDHLFGRGTKPSEVASYLAWTAIARTGCSDDEIHDMVTSR